jgi:hypothetical protein
MTNGSFQLTKNGIGVPQIIIANGFMFVNMNLTTTDSLSTSKADCRAKPGKGQTYSFSSPGYLTLSTMCVNTNIGNSRPEVIEPTGISAIFDF